MDAVAPDTFLAVTSRYRRKSMKTLEELTPGGCRWPVADLCTAGDRPGSKTRFCGEPVEERSVGTQLCPYCATHAAMDLVLKMLLQFLEGTLPGRGQGHGSAVAAAPRRGKPFGPPTPPASSPPKGDKVVPFQSDWPHFVPERPRKERPQPTPANPFQRPGEGGDVANVQPDSDEIKFYPG